MLTCKWLRAAGSRELCLPRDSTDFLFGGGGCLEHESLCPSGFFEYFKLSFYNSGSYCPDISFFKNNLKISILETAVLSLSQFSYLETKDTSDSQEFCEG